MRAEHEMTVGDHVRIDDLCGEFEDELRNGGHPRIEGALDQVPLRCQEVLLYELLRIELEYRGRAGDSWDPAVYRDRFPHYTGVVERALADAGESPDERLSAQPEWHARAASRQRPPTLPDDYELLEEIARGGQGVVYRARQISLDRLVAIKVLHAHEGSERVLRRFEREARMAARIEHPNIVAVHDVGRHAGRPYLVMEYVDGRTLADIARVGRIDPRTACEYVATAARAVQAAHDRGVLHRDVKPANIMIDADGRIRVADFGLARRLDGEGSLTDAGDLLGTVNYMSPEQATGRIDEVGPATDVYSLGATLYELLTGRLPFRGTSVLETIRCVVEKDPVRPRFIVPELPESLERICRDCLAKSPASRPSSAAALADALERELAAYVTIDQPSKRPHPSASLEWFNHRWVSATAAFVVLLFIAFLWRPWSRSDPSTGNAASTGESIASVGGDGASEAAGNATERSERGERPTSPAALPAVGQWHRYVVDDWSCEIRGLGDEAPHERWFLVESRPGHGRGNVVGALLLVDLDRHRKEGRLDVLEGYEWTGLADAVTEDVRPADVARFDRFESRLAGHDPAEFGLQAQLESIFEQTRRADGRLPEPSRGELADGIDIVAARTRLLRWLGGDHSPLYARIPEAGEGVRATGSIEFEGLGGVPILYEIVLRGLTDENVDGRPYRWLALEIRSGRDGRSFPETVVVRVDANWNGADRRFRADAGWEWVGRLDDGLAGETGALVELRTEVDGLVTAHADPAEERQWRLAARDALVLLFDADLVTSQPLYGRVREGFRLKRHRDNLRPRGRESSVEFGVQLLEGATTWELAIPDDVAPIDWRFAVHEDAPGGWVNVLATMPGRGNQPAFEATYVARNETEFVENEWPRLRAAIESFEAPTADLWDRVALPEPNDAITYGGSLTVFGQGTYNYRTTLGALGDEVIAGRTHRWVQVYVRSWQPAEFGRNPEETEETALVLLDVDRYQNGFVQVARDELGRYRGYIASDGVVVRYDPRKDALAETLDSESRAPAARLGFREVFSLLFAAEVETTEAIRKLRELLAAGRVIERHPKPGTFSAPGWPNVETRVYSLPRFRIPATSLDINYDIARSDEVPFGFTSVDVTVRNADAPRGFDKALEATLNVKGGRPPADRTLPPEEELIARAESVARAAALAPIRPNAPPNARPGLDRFYHDAIVDLLRRGDRSSAAKWFRRLQTRYPTSPLTETARRLIENAR